MHETRRSSSVTDARVVARDELAGTNWTIETLCAEFADPRDAYVYSPTVVTLRALAIAYGDRLGQSADDLLRTLRVRSSAERWVELRAEVGKERTRAMTRIVVERSATIVASMTVDFSLELVIGRLRRYRALAAYVEHELESLEVGDGGFSKALSAAMHELRLLEASILDQLPETGMRDIAQQFFSSGDKSKASMDVVVESLKVRVGKLFTNDSKPREILAGFESAWRLEERGEYAAVIDGE